MPHIFTNDNMWMYHGQDLKAKILALGRLMKDIQLYVTILRETILVYQNFDQFPSLSKSVIH